MTTQEGTEMTAPDPLTRRAVAEMIRAERRETRLFLVAQLATTRRRLERLEARTFAGAGTPDYIDRYAADVDAEYRAGAEEPIG
jgi:hypothetical protein